jgi:hypothetical protein
MGVPVGELSLEEELQRTRAELFEERRRFEAATAIIGEQAERIFTLTQELRKVRSERGER